MYARAVCKRANAGHEAEVAGEGYGKSSGQVYVIQVGTTYAVFDPAYPGVLIQALVGR
jgi:hypothetical protein